MNKAVRIKTNCPCGRTFTFITYAPIWDKPDEVASSFRGSRILCTPCFDKSRPIERLMGIGPKH